MLVHLLLLTVLAEQPTQHTHATHPHDLGGETRLTGTLSATHAGVTALTLLCQTTVDAKPTVDGVGLADDEAVLDELAHVLACTREYDRYTRCNHRESSESVGAGAHAR